MCMFFNYIQVGIVIAFLHDCSDTLRAINRVIGDLKVSFFSPTLFSVSFYLSLIGWLYARVVVFGACVIVQISENIPEWYSKFWFSLPVYCFGIVLTIGLYFLQCYWAVILHRAYKK